MKYLSLLLVCMTSVAFGQTQNDSQWSQTLERISPSVVSIRVDGTRAFDTEWSQSSQATGFVVDAKRGIILTNRHVVTTGPIVAEAVFVNHEEVALRPIYRDPVHDFGFFQYNPDDLSYIEPLSLSLRPDLALVGKDIRVVGNDAGEQISILAGTLAKLDRDAPDYGIARYNDFNTFYMQAASNTSGGSSGSPVIDINGYVIGLNAGGTSGAASSFYLPLPRVKRALELLQNGGTLSRGTLQTLFTHRAYDELKRLGLDKDTEAAARKHNKKSKGMLTVAEVVPEGPGAAVFEVGDILVNVNNRLVTDFVVLEEMLDSHVGKKLSFQVVRAGVRHTVSATVDDLHAITPSAYIEVGGAILHPLSYQQARHFNVPVEGIYVADYGFMLHKAGIPRGALIRSINRIPIQSLSDLETALLNIADGERVVFRYSTATNPYTTDVAMVDMDWLWSRAEYCKRRDSIHYVTRSERWDCRTLVSNAKTAPKEPALAAWPNFKDPVLGGVVPSLVLVNFDMPYVIEGVSDRNYYGTGLLVDKARGWVVVDRNTVPVGLGDVQLTFAGSARIKGKVFYLHPKHNLAVVQYNPAELDPASSIKEAKLNTKSVHAGDELTVVGLRQDHQWVRQTALVASLESLSPPANRASRFVDRNLDVFKLINGPEDTDGVIVNHRGQVMALWSSFAFRQSGVTSQASLGMPIQVVVDMLERLHADQPLYTLDVDWVSVPLSEARDLGVPNEWIKPLNDNNPKRRQALKIQNVLAMSTAFEQLQAGDVLLKVNDTIVTNFLELEHALQSPSATLALWRDDAVHTITTNLRPIKSGGVSRVLLWAGAVLHDPHDAILQVPSDHPQGVFISNYSYGSPASRFGLRSGRRIISLNDQPIHHLKDFAAMAKTFKDGQTVRLKTVKWNDKVDVVTLKLDEHSWPTQVLSKDDEGRWHRTLLSE